MFVRKKQVTGEPGAGQEILVCDITFNVLFLFLLPAATEAEVQILLSISPACLLGTSLPRHTT
jgi:hypothetical protein